MRILVTILILALSFSVFAQKVTKTYWGYSNNVHEEFQVNSVGVKNGYYKEYYKEGQLYESGFYKSGQKSGLWTTYDMNWSGQISSTMEYENDKMNGQYKQWCWEKSKRYLCGDYIYKDDLEVSSIKYYSNGKKSSQNDANGYFEWFEDGTPGVETKNGKTYKYQMFSADYYHNTEKKEVRRITYDTLGLKYEYYYDYDTKYDGDHLKASQISIDIEDIETKGKVTNFQWRFYSDGIIYEFYKNGNKCKLDSTSAKQGYNLLKHEPTGYFDKLDSVYNEDTGDIKICKNDGSCQLFHYYDGSSKYEYRLIKLNTEGKQVEENYYERNRSDDRHYISNQKTFKDGKLVKEEFNSFEGSTYKNLIIKEYYDNGVLKSEMNYIDGFNNKFYESGKLLKKSGFFVKDQRPCCYLTEYYESGKIKIDVPLKDSINLSNKRFYYDENSNVIKIEEFESYSGKTEKTIEGNKEIGEYFISDLTAQYNSVFYIQKKTWNSGGYYDYSYEYPKGQNLYVKSYKVLESIYKNFTKAQTDAERNSFVKEYENSVNKLLEIAKTDTKELNEKLSKVKKVEEIKQILGI